MFLQKYHFNVSFTEPAGSFVTCPVLYNLLKQSKAVSDLISPGKTDHSCCPWELNVSSPFLKSPP